MTNARGHMAILAGAGVAAVLVSAFLLLGPPIQPATTSPVVVTLAQRPSPSQAAPAPSKPLPAPIAGDPASLARALQRELRRVGCYDGEISGAWNAASRAAMKAFMERVNASLPVDSPDQILLALVQGHRGQACSAGCKPDEVPAADGRCQPKVVATKSDGVPEQREARLEQKAESAIKPVPVPVPTVRLPQEPSAPVPAARAAPPAPPIPQLQEPARPPPPANAGEPRSARHAGPVPTVGVYERRPRRYVRRGSSRPPAIVRSVIRNLRRAASVW